MPRFALPVAEKGLPVAEEALPRVRQRRQFGAVEQRRRAPALPRIPHGCGGVDLRCLDAHGHTLAIAGQDPRARVHIHAVHAGDFEPGFAGVDGVPGERASLDKDVILIKK